MDKKIQNLDEEVSTIKSERDNANASLELSQQESRKQLNAARDTIQALQDDLKSKSSELQRTIDQLTTNTTSANESIADLNRRLNTTLQSAREEVNSASALVAELTTANDTLRGELDAAKASEDNLRQEHNLLQLQYKNLDWQSNVMRNRNRTYEDKIERSKREIKRLQAERDELRDRVIDIDTLRERCSDIEDQLQAVRGAFSGHAIDSRNLTRILHSLPPANEDTTPELESQRLVLVALLDPKVFSRELSVLLREFDTILANLQDHPEYCMILQRYGEQILQYTEGATALIERAIGQERGFDWLPSLIRESPPSYPPLVWAWIRFWMMRDDRPELFIDVETGEDRVNLLNDIIYEGMEDDDRLQIWAPVTVDGISRQMYRHFNEIGWREGDKWIKFHYSKIQVEYSQYGRGPMRWWVELDDEVIDFGAGCRHFLDSID